MTIEQAVPEETERKTARNFKSSPFRGSLWEIIGGVFEKGGSFLVSDFEVIAQEQTATDPMFEAFDPEKSTARPSARGNGAPQSSPQGVTEEDLKQRLTEQFEEGKKEGREQGLIEAERIATEKVKELEEQVRIFVGTLERQVQESFIQMEQEALKLSLSVSKKILEATAELKPEYILEVIRNGMKSLGAARPLKVRVSEQDYEFLEVVGLPSDLSSEVGGMSFVADSAVRSGCVIETDFGEIDLRLDEMWEKVKTQLFEALT